MSSSPNDAVVNKKKEVLQASAIDDHIRQIELDDLDPTFVHQIGLKSSLISPKYALWKKQRDIEDKESDLISYVQELKDEEISTYFTDDILEEAKKWDDEHDYGIINSIRYSIIDQLKSKQLRPTITFDVSKPNQWIIQDFESVRAGDLCFKRCLQIYATDIYLNNSNQKDFQNSITIFNNKSSEEKVFLYHGTTENNAQSIISRGIYLYTRGSRPGDFGHGFYTTTNFIQALKHAENKAIKTHGEQRPVCLVFIMSKDEFNSHRIVHLSYEENEEQFARVQMDENSINNDNIFKWEMFVYKCLNNDPPLPFMYDKDAVIGPVSANLRDINLGYKPIKKGGTTLPTQTAIVSMKLACVLLDALQGVIIWGRKN